MQHWWFGRNLWIRPWSLWCCWENETQTEWHWNGSQGKFSL